MIGLILKDIFNLKKQFKLIGGIVILYAIIFIPQGNADFISSMIVMISALTVTTIFGFDEIVKWDRYALTMPITRKEIVFSRYLISIGLMILGSMIGLIVGIISSFTKENFILKDFTIIMLGAAGLGIIFISIAIPIIYKFGVEKSRLLIILICFAPVALVMVMSKILNISVLRAETLVNILNIMPYVAPLKLILILILVTSYFISLNIFIKKEF